MRGNWRGFRRTAAADAAAGKPARSKYGAKRTTVDGITFASRKEARRYGDLRLLERAGEIRGLRVQPRYPIIINGQPVKYPSGRPLVYVADFSYYDVKRGATVVEDVKGIRKTPRAPGEKKPRHEGTDTDASQIKRALVAAIYGITVEVL